MVRNNNMEGNTTMVVPSRRQTKLWRNTQDWYKNGKKNECEYFQVQCLEQILGQSLTRPTHQRLHIRTKQMEHKKTPLQDQDGFEWTEDFDASLVHDETIYYFNLKFVCDHGGTQTRTLREVYHFVYTQLEHLVKWHTPGLFFINILDGDFSSHCMPKFHYLLQKEEFATARDKVFIGDMSQFDQFWQEKRKQKKKAFGQFYTTQYAYILQGMHVPDNLPVVEPFVGAGDLLSFLPVGHTVEHYDIDPQLPDTIQQDTLTHPPCYDGKFLLTNPPYLAKNKHDGDKTLFLHYQVDDLYKCLLKELLSNQPIGGILIIPVNFWCSFRKNDRLLRKQFLEVYQVLQLNIFEEPVFHDTDYSVCAFQFTRKQQHSNTIPITIHPSRHSVSAVLEDATDYTIGGEIFHLPRTYKYTITRLTSANQSDANTNLLAKCIDDEVHIGLSLVPTDQIYVDNTPHHSARSYASLVITPTLSLEQQEQLVCQFNKLLKNYREQYHSLFLTTYREKKRKRIPFDLLYHLVGHLLETCF